MDVSQYASRMGFARKAPQLSACYDLASSVLDTYENPLADRLAIAYQEGFRLAMSAKIFDRYSFPVIERATEKVLSFSIKEQELAQFFDFHGRLPVIYLPDDINYRHYLGFLAEACIIGNASFYTKKALDADTPRKVRALNRDMQLARFSQKVFYAGLECR
jgi:hypothetical protein